MENYVKGDTKKVYDPPKLTVEGAVEMKVTGGSKIRNILGFAMSSMSDDKNRHIVWNGTANSISKTISCVEILKRKMKGLHQITQIGFMRVEDFWEPKVEGLDTLKVNTNVPTISILLSKDPLDSNDPSYQAPGVTDVVWAAGHLHKKQGHRSKSNKKFRDKVDNVKEALKKPKKLNKDQRSKQSAKKRKNSRPVEDSVSGNDKEASSLSQLPSNDDNSN